MPPAVAITDGQRLADRLQDRPVVLVGCWRVGGVLVSEWVRRVGDHAGPAVVVVVQAGFGGGDREGELAAIGVQQLHHPGWLEAGAHAGAGDP